jgi:hypothetical protein
MQKTIKAIPIAILLMASIAMAQPTLITPPKDSTIFDPTPFFDWSDESGALSYRIQVDTSPDFGILRIDTTTTSSEWIALSSLAESESLYNYYWRVRVEDPGPGSWSNVWSFGLLNKGPDLIYPEISDTINGPTPTFIWLRQLGTQVYRIVIWGEVLPIVDDTIADTTYTCPVTLTDGSYSWDVQAIDCLGNISPVSTRSFTLTILPSGWTQKDSMPTTVLVPKPKYVKDGGSLVGAIMPTEDGAFALYAFRGNKSNEYYRYTTGWVAMESLLFGVKPDKPTKINKKLVGKGASLCFDGDNTIYATKGNGTKEFWAYNIAMNTWAAKPFVPVPKTLKGGTSIAYYDGKVYLLSGGHKPTDPTNFYGYEVEEDTWVPLPGVHISPTFKAWKDGSCIAQLGGSIYALKGGDKANVFFSYNIIGNTWTQEESLPIMDSIYGKYKKVLVKDGGATTSSEDLIYAVKGAGSNVFWQYSIASGWTPLESIPRLNKKSVVKTGSSLAYADGKVWLLKGNNSPEFWQFQPAITKSKY